MLSFTLAACGTDYVAPSPGPTTIPRNPAGAFSVHSQHDLASAAPDGIIAALLVATNDPARYIVDWTVDALPDGTIKTAARDAAPVVAAYLMTELTAIAPHLAPGLARASVELAAIATHFGTQEALRVTHQGNGMRTITGLQFLVGASPVSVGFEDHGLPDIEVDVRVSIDHAGQLTLAKHVLTLSYGRLLRLGLDYAVVPSIAPRATSAAAMLNELVDCKQVGALVAGALGVGSADMFQTGCTVGLATAASQLVARIDALDATPLELEVTGTAQGVDSDRDGQMDLIEHGAWSGTARYAATTAPLADSTFEGTKL